MVASKKHPSTTKRFEADIPEGTRLDRSQASTGAFRGTLRDNRTNLLVGHAELREIDEEERDEDDGPGFGALVAGLAFVGLTIGAVAVVNSARGRKAQLRDAHWQLAEARQRNAHAAVSNARVSAPAGWYDYGPSVQRWWDGQQWTEHFQSVRHQNAAPAGWYDDGSGRQRWWDGVEWTTHFQATAGPIVPASDEISDAAPTNPSRDIVNAFDQPRLTMSRAEWQARVREMLIARAISEHQWRLLSVARIEDADHELLEWQNELAKLTPQQFSDRIGFTLESAPVHQNTALHPATSGVYGDATGHQVRVDRHKWGVR